MNVRETSVCRCQKVKTEYRGDDGLNKLYDLLKYIIYASFYMIVIKTGMDFYGYKRFPKLYESYSAPWYTEALSTYMLGISNLSELCQFKFVEFKNLI